MEPSVASLFYRMMLARITASRGTLDLNDTAKRVAADIDPGSIESILPWLNVARQAQRNWAAAQAVNAGTVAGEAGFALPVDPTARASEGQFLARVLVTATNPDGSTSSNVILVPFSGQMNAAEIRAAAEATAERERGRNMGPPPFANRVESATLESIILTVGRSR